MSKDAINTRFKENYENRYRFSLTRRTPVILRLDMKAGHTYCRGLNKPFDEGYMEDMKKTAIYLCEQIQGAVCAYTQSDEISILLIDYEKLNSEAWFDYNLQKITSISASLATSKFNQLRYIRNVSTYTLIGNINRNAITVDEVVKTKLANFDSRAFNIPKEEVNNYFIARQQDAIKNSISMVAQSLYSSKELYKKNGNEMQEMIFQKGQNWNDLHYEKKRGTFIIKNIYWDDELVNVKYIPTKEKIRLSTNSGIYKNEDSFYNSVLDKKEVKVTKIRTKWEAVVTPTFSQDNYWYINYLCKNLNIS